MNDVRIMPIQGIPEIKVDDNLAEITFDVLNKSEIGIEENDIFVAEESPYKQKKRVDQKAPSPLATPAYSSTEAAGLR